ncbi:MAG: helix-turn-helix transcriptional regulator [Bacteroidales bacterium]|nr:helix-turn-helix transcriptional regulator [Bacteroidales bacterium]
MASFVGTNRTYLSEYLNDSIGVTFYEYINEWRVKEACRIMDDASEKRRTMLEVAEMSGFNSGSTFNRSFSKVMGMTPSAYARKRG